LQYSFVPIHESDIGLPLDRIELLTLVSLMSKMPRT
jgi:hypothetical protein